MALQAHPTGSRAFRVADWDYFITYFEASLRGAASGLAVADQFAAFVEHYATAGFEFLRTDQVPFRIQPGCLAGLFGASETYGSCTVVTFRRAVR